MQRAEAAVEPGRVGDEVAAARAAEHDALVGAQPAQRAREQSTASSATSATPPAASATIPVVEEVVHGREG